MEHAAGTRQPEFFCLPERRHESLAWKQSEHVIHESRRVAFRDQQIGLLIVQPFEHMLGVAHPSSRDRTANARRDHQSIS